ncbi:MAG: hypothetical protein ACREIP_09625 [Alphaproteobacteria bacterium]
MSWLARIAGSAGARIAAFAALAGVLLLFLARVFRAGRDAETARGSEAAHRHQVKTATQTSRSDEAMADPHSERARRVRRQFERED